MNWTDIRVWGDLCRQQADRQGDRIAFVDADGRTTSFAGFDDRVNRLNNALAARGLTKGERVAVLARNRTEYLEVYGVAKTGLIAVPLNWRLTAEELLRVLDHCRPAAVVADAEHAPLLDGLRPAMDYVQLYAQMGPEAALPGWTGYETLLAGAESRQPVPTSPLAPDDVACITYTSGTTGAPKGVALSHRGILGNARLSADEVLHLTADDRTLAVMPLFHVGGMWYHLHASYAAGCTSVLMPRFDASAVLAALADHAITNTHLVPTMIAALLADPAVGSADLRQLRLIFYAASSMPAELLKRALTTLRGCGFLQSYGSTESGMLTELSPADHLEAMAAGERLLASCGRPAGSNRLRVVDEDMNSLPPGAVGEIAVQGGSMMVGYWNDAAATANAVRDGWLRTGDLGYLDAEGYLYILDRKNDMIVTGGENVYPSEVEEVLYRDPAVFQAAVFGVPDPLWVEKVVAAVVLKPGHAPTAQDIIHRARAHLAAYKCPKELYIRGQLPMNAAGKILKKDLKQAYARP